MPNLFSALPVAILWCVLASMSGLTRTEILTARPLAEAIDDSSSSSGSDSTLMQRMPSSTASASSRAVLPRPENMILSAGTPASRARISSPSDTTSAPAPSLAKRGDHRLVGIRLHGVADQRVHVGEGAGEHLVVPRERRGRIAIERRSDRGGERVEIHRLGVQHAVAISEVVHGLRFRWRVILSENRFPLFGITRGLS